MNLYIFIHGPFSAGSVTVCWMSMLGVDCLRSIFREVCHEFCCENSAGVSRSEPCFDINEILLPVSSLAHHPT